MFAPTLALALAIAAQSGVPTFSYAHAGDAGLKLSATPALIIEEDAGCVFNRVSDVVVLSNGNIAVANTGNSEVCLFTPAGRLIKKVGRGGGGPGEYRDMRSLQSYTADSLLVWDGLLQRLSVLAPDGTFARSITVQRRDSLGYPRFAAGLRDGTLLVGFSEVTQMAPQREPVMFMQQVFRYDRNGTAQSHLGRFVGSEHFVQAVPPRMGGTAYWDRAFGRRFGFAVTRTGFIAGDGSGVEIREYGNDGKLVRVHKTAHAPRPVTAQDIAEYRRLALSAAKPDRRAVEEKRLAEMRFPESYPAFRSLRTDAAGRIWLEEYPRPGVTIQRWTVLDPATKQSSLVVTPPRFQLLPVSRDLACGVARDELDLERIRCYRISSN